MKLHITEWTPTHPRKTALLLHGIGSASPTWHRLARDLIMRGYQVIAPDLSGHGSSYKLDTSSGYSVKSWGEDVEESIKDYPSPDLIIGHSLGGLVAAEVADKLETKPSQVILIDPAWRLPHGIIAYFAKRVLSKMSTYTSGQIHRSKPTWSGKDINIDLKSFRMWDKATLQALRRRDSVEIVRRYLKNKIPTCIIKPERSLLVSRSLSRYLKRKGVDVINIARVSHELHRDDPEMFFRKIEHLVEGIALDTGTFSKVSVVSA